MKATQCGDRLDFISETLQMNQNKEKLRGKPQYFQWYGIPELKGFNSGGKGAFSQVSALDVSARGA